MDGRHINICSYDGDCFRTYNDERRYDSVCETHLIIENEFILPHTTIARVKFGNFTSTVVTNTLPINNTHSKLFVKTYRNFWNSIYNTLFDDIYNSLGDKLTKDMMYNTVIQDKSVVENIKLKYADGKFNMKFDKLQNVYRTFYRKLINNITVN